jgi:hypothetical protein
MGLGIVVNSNSDKPLRKFKRGDKVIRLDKLARSKSHIPNPEFEVVDHIGEDKYFLSDLSIQPAENLLPYDPGEDVED